MHLGTYIGLAHQSEKQLAKALRLVADKHGSEPDIYHTCQLLAAWSEAHEAGLATFVARYSEARETEPERLMASLFDKPRAGELGLLRDLHDLWLLTQEVNMSWKVIVQAARLLRDQELENACLAFEAETHRQADWLQTRIKQAAPQILVVAS